MTKLKSPNKIVKVGGQEFTVPVETDNEAIRQHLVSTFPEVASATISKSTRNVDGLEYEVVEFVKRAGTKGGEGALVASLLSAVPPDWEGLGRPSRDNRTFADLMEGRLTVDQALALKPLQISRLTLTRKGYQLCQKLDLLSAAPAPRVPDTW